MSANRQNSAELSVNVLHCSNLSELNSEIFFPINFLPIFVDRRNIVSKSSSDDWAALTLCAIDFFYLHAFLLSLLFDYYMIIALSQSFAT